MAILFSFLILAAAAAAPLPLPPVDECASQPGFAAFRDSLRGAIADKDAKALLALTDRDIDISFGGEKGQAEFVRYWKLDRPESSELWNELSAVLDLGCATDGTVAVSPSFINKLPGEFDIFETMVASGPDVPVYAKAEAGQAIATLQWEVVQTPDWDGLAEWVPIQLRDGRTGYVETRLLRSPVDYRAFFEQVDGAWKMTIFIAGD